MKCHPTHFTVWICKYISDCLEDLHSFFAFSVFLYKQLALAKPKDSIDSDYLTMKGLATNE